MKFERGDEVEIISKEEGFEGSYYPAIVVSKMKETVYIVQYKTLLKDDESGPLRQVHIIDEIRPTPPEVSATKFRLHQRVDAYDGDGWWVAFVTGIKGSRHTVYFETTEEEMIFEREKLRVHQDWSNGKWVVSNSMKKGKGRKALEMIH